ncbi:Hypothetical predicted protein [Cloeon dipterum]|uniref:CHK kinase-like domain-containing protein n=1 Tax=Cloeon dipterum TaxID=197152 RepID=A0A8S1CHD4_9INSE|nr:Hypothetical predicted protein [Cloeon dipterum]
MASPREQLLSVGEVQTALKKAVGPNATMRSYTVKLLGAGKLGYMGEHGLVQVEYQESRITYQATNRTSFFIKRVPDRKIFKDFIINFGLFAKEREIYEKLLPMMCKSLKISRMPAPECYVICDEKYLVLEDLNRAGYKLKDKNDCLDLAHCKAVFEAVALLHAGGIAIEAKTGKMMAFHMKYNHEIVIVKENRAPLDISAYWNAASLVTTFGLLTKMDEFKERLADISKEKLLKRLRKVWDEITEIAAGFSAKFTNVLSHGDLWINNIMFKSEDNKAVKAILVDFQTYRYAPPVLDLLSFLHFTTSRKFRWNHQSELLKFYHSTLVKILLKANVNADLAPSLEELEKSAYDLRVLGIGLAVRYLPTVLKQEVTPEHQHQMSAAEKDGMPQEFIRDSTDLIIRSFARSPVMRSRVLEAMVELVDFLEL